MRIHPVNTTLSAAAALVVAACGSSTTVQVTTEGADGPRPQENVIVQFLPFDRDSVFDALDARASSPRPEMSAELQAEYDRVGSLQQQWRAKDSEWGEQRDQLQQLSTRLQALDPRDEDYRRLFDQFGRLESTVNALDRERKTLFDQFTKAQESVTTRIDSFKVVRGLWEDEAYADYFDIQAELLGGKEAVEDTTGAAGYATATLSGGDWWATARTDVAEGELYWNVPVAGRDTIVLNESNGELRARL